MSKTLRKAISLAGSGRRYPAMALVREDPEMAAALSKMTHGKIKPRFDQSGNIQPDPPSTFALKNISDKVAQNISDTETVMQTFPEMELIAQILISSILSPKDMMNTEMTFKAPESILPPDVANAMINVIRQFYETDYKIKPYLSKILRKVLFDTGSYPLAVIPENSIDDAINSTRRLTMESLSEHINRDGTMRPLGLIGNVTKKQPSVTDTKSSFSMESFDSYGFDTNYEPVVDLAKDFDNKPQETYITVTDNFSVLKIPHVQQRLRETNIVKALNGAGAKALYSVVSRVGLEAYSQEPTSVSKTHKLSDREMSALVYKDKQFTYKPIAQLKTQEQLSRRSIGNPLVMHLPSESVIPVYVPGNVSQQVGFFVLLDEDGNPVEKSAEVDYYQQLNARMNSGGSFPSAMLQKVKSQMGGFDPNAYNTFDYSARVYGTMVEQDLLARLRNGVYGNGVALANKQEVYRIMLSRTLSKQRTQLLFLPIELMTYFAFKFDSDGIGKSMMDDMKILNSLRSMLLFANVMAAIKNSIGRTEVKIKFDEEDPDPQKTVERVIGEILRSRQQAFPVGTNSPMDIVDWLQRAGFEFTYEGHPGMPDVQVDFGEKNSTYVKPDTDLEDSLRKRSIMGTGMSPANVDAAYEAEFATSVLTNNILLSKRVMQLQEQFEPLIMDHLHKHTMNTETLLQELRGVLEKNYDKIIKRLDKAKSDDNDLKAPVGLDLTAIPKEMAIQQLLYEFVMGYEVSLPRPNSVTLENQAAALKIYSETLDEALNAYISDSFFNSETGGDVSTYVNTLKETVKAYFIRKWMGENGMMPELSELVATDAEGKPLINLYEDQVSMIENLTKTISFFMGGLQPIKRAANVEEQQRQSQDNTEGGATPTTSDSGSFSSSSSSDTGSSDDFNFGGDDFNDFGQPNGGENSSGQDNSNPDTSDVDEEEESLNAGVPNTDTSNNTPSNPI